MNGPDSGLQIDKRKLLGFTGNRQEAAHLHAVWLAETGRELSADMPHVLDLSAASLPVQDEIAGALSDPEIAVRAAKRMERILASINPELTPDAAPWAADRVRSTR